MRDQILRHLDTTANPVLLDVACGGAGYIADALSLTSNPPEKIVLVDQDPSALSFARERLEPWKERVEAICIPLKKLSEFLPGKEGYYSLVVSAGLLDYLSDPIARALLHGFASVLRRGGRIAISNMHPNDPSRLPKEWGAAWDILYRDENQLASLFPSEAQVETTVSKNRTLVMATGTLGQL